MNGEKTRFQVGHAKLGGRAKGTRNRFSEAFLKDFLADWLEHGVEAIRIMRVERQDKYVAIGRSIVPQEFEITMNTTAQLTDERLEAVEHALELIATGTGDNSGAGESGEDEATRLN